MHTKTQHPSYLVYHPHYIHDPTRKPPMASSQCHSKLSGTATPRCERPPFGCFPPFQTPFNTPQSPDLPTQRFPLPTQTLLQSHLNPPPPQHPITSHTTLSFLWFKNFQSPPLSHGNTVAIHVHKHTPNPSLPLPTPRCPASSSESSFPLLSPLLSNPTGTQHDIAQPRTRPPFRLSQTRSADLSQGRIDLSGLVKGWLVRIGL